MKSLFGKSRGNWELRTAELQQRYADALQQDDLQALIECSGALSIAYSAMECNPLAERWMDEYVSNLDRVSPGIRTRMQALRAILPN